MADRTDWTTRAAQLARALAPLLSGTRAMDRSAGEGQTAFERLRQGARTGVERASRVFPVAVQAARTESLLQAFHAATVGRALHEEPSNAARGRVGPSDRDPTAAPIRHEQAFELESARPLTLPFDAVQRARRACRRFGPRPLAHADLSNLLAHGAGCGLAGSERVVPSAHGLYPVDVYAVGRLAVGATGITEGAFVYDYEGHRLLQVGASATRDRSLPRDIWHPEVVEADYGSLDALVGATVLFLVGDLHLAELSHGASGYQRMLLEAGHMGQALCLAAAALGLGALPVDVTHFAGRGVTEVLDVDGLARVPVHAIAVGARAQTP